MTFKIPASAEELLGWEWSDLEPGYRELLADPLREHDLSSWLERWSRVSECADELYNRLNIATTVNTQDKAAEQRYGHYLDSLFPQIMAWEQKLKMKLLATGREPGGFEIPLRNYRSDASLFREENLDLLAEEQKLGIEVDKVVGAQTVEWEGRELTLKQLGPFRQSSERQVRQSAWEAHMQRVHQDREELDQLWVKGLNLRMQIARNAGKKDYREYKWQQYYRFDYTPEDSLRFHAAIAQTVVPAVSSLLETHRRRLNLEAVRPWDIDLNYYVDPFQRPPLQPFQTVEEQLEITQRIFDRVDPVLGGYFSQMRRDGLMDIPNRKNKAGGAYCAGLNLIRKPFVFCNSVGTHDDVQTLFHESGHAFHVYESAHLPYLPQLSYTMEIAEVASMGMELLTAPYLVRKAGGFYTESEAARAQAEHLVTALMFWPYMAVVDAFQHWVYLHPDEALDPSRCDDAWEAQWDRFMPGVDWGGYPQYKRTGWQRKMHIFQVPFYYLEYGLAQLGAVQVWARSLVDPKKGVRDYRRALALGGTRPLPELFQAAGAKLAFDEQTLGQMVGLMLSQIERLDGLAGG